MGRHFAALVRRIHWLRFFCESHGVHRFPGQANRGRTIARYWAAITRVLPAADRTACSERPHWRLLQQRQLVRGGPSVEYRVAMRKAAEAIDDRLVRDCIARPGLVAQTRDQLHSVRLIFAVLAMLEWHVE